jgi:hypothetical protein
MADARARRLSTTVIWHGTSATAPAMAVSSTNGVEVLGGPIGALGTHEFIDGLADALGCAWLLLTLTLPLTYHHRDHAQDGQRRDNVVVAEKTENQNSAGLAPETKIENPEVPPPPPNDSNSNALFTAVTNLNDHLTTLHAALPPRTALLLFSGHSDPRSMSALAARRAGAGLASRGTRAAPRQLLREVRVRRCAGVRRMIGRSKRRSCGRGWGCCLLGLRLRELIALARAMTILCA